MRHHHLRSAQDGHPARRRQPCPATSRGGCAACASWIGMLPIIRYSWHCPDAERGLQYMQRPTLQRSWLIQVWRLLRCRQPDTDQVGDRFHLKIIRVRARLFGRIMQYRQMLPTGWAGAIAHSGALARNSRACPETPRSSPSYLHRSTPPYGFHRPAAHVRRRNQCDKAWRGRIRRCCEERG